MTTTTHGEYGSSTEALEVAAAFKEQIAGKTILVTGVNPNGIGFTTAEAFASQAPRTIIITSRSLSKLQESVKILKTRHPDVNYRELQLDLSTQKTVRAAAEQVLSWSDVPRIDIIVNSAGVMNGPERIINVDGIEMTFATNHIGHFLLTNLLMPKLIRASKGGMKGQTRIINVSSLSPTRGAIRWSDMNFDKKNKDLPQEEQPDYDICRAWGINDPENKSYLGLEAYTQSKVANVLFSIGANNRLYERFGILSFAVHPGVIVTELGRFVSDDTKEAVQKMASSGRFTYKSLGAGSATSLVAALDPKLILPAEADGKENFGVYMIDCQISDRADPRALANTESEKLWSVSEDLVGQKFSS